MVSVWWEKQKCKNCRLVFSLLLGSQVPIFSHCKYSIKIKLIKKGIEYCLSDYWQMNHCSILAPLFCLFLVWVLHWNVLNYSNLTPGSMSIFCTHDHLGVALRHLRKGCPPDDPLLANKLLNDFHYVMLDTSLTHPSQQTPTKLNLDKALCHFLCCSFIFRRIFCQKMSNSVLSVLSLYIMHPIPWILKVYVQQI